MRKWYKYFLVFGAKEHTNIKKHQKFDEFEKAMGGYESNEFYQDRDKFFSKYLRGRFVNYKNYLENNLVGDEKIFSIASGRCINELLLIEKDFNVTCSDLDIPKSYYSAKKIFGDFNYKTLDILNSFTQERYSCILSLGIVYAFSKNELEKFFTNINKSLEIDGILILDSSSSANNFLTFLFDRIYLKLENFLISLILNILGKKNSTGIRHHGYKFTNSEIIELAKKKVFEIVHKNSQDYLTEISRSKIVNKLIKYIPISKYFFLLIGRFMPYLRFFKFKKIKDI